MKEDREINVTKYRIKLWDREIDIVHYIIRYGDRQEVNDIMFDLQDNCPKCELLFNPKPQHGTFLTCKCGAEFSFHGALHPSPLGDTRLEVERAIEEQNDNDKN